MERDLSERERDVLGAMIRQASDPTSPDRVTMASRRRWLAQMSNIRVVGRCRCETCPSIDLNSDGPPGMGDSRVVLGAATPDATLLLFIDDDRPSYLELAPSDPDVHIAEFPPVDTMEFTSPESA